LACLPLLLAVLAGAPAVAQTTRTVEFQVRHATALGESVYVAGDLPELGSGDVTQAVRMVPGPDGLWWLKVALPAGASYRYWYLVRDNAPRQLESAQNGRRLGDQLEARVPGDPSLRTVRVRYLSGWPSARVAYVRGATGWAEAPLQRVGPGRGAGEHLYEAELTVARRELWFVPLGPQGDRDLSPGGAPYRTGWSSVTLVDGALLQGARGPDDLRSAGAGRWERIREWRPLGGMTGGVQGGGQAIRRDLFVYTPPGYDPQGQARYPVLYMHDGQNLFGPDAMFGGWRVEEAADRLIRSGQMTPLIVVGLANTADRMSEYMPEQEEGGRAGDYVDFLVDTLKPWVDAHYRTRPEREHTGVLGSSLGGLVSLYMGWRRPDVVSRVGSLSGSFWLKGWVEQLSQEHKPLRIWLDSGNRGNSADSMEPTIYVRDLLLRRGYVLGHDLDHDVDYGASHNERFWRARLHQALRFLFPPE
jgi:predicted alpha/beta superfamily hydrolase